MASGILDIPVLESPPDPSQVIGEAMKTTSDVLKKGFKDVKGLFDLVSDVAPDRKQVSQTNLFTKESIKVYQDINKGKLSKAKKAELKSFSEIAKQETDAMMGFGDAIGDSIANGSLIPSMSTIANGIFDMRDDFIDVSKGIKKGITEGLLKLIPQGLKDFRDIAKERSIKDDKANKKKDKQDKQESKFWKSSLTIAGKMLKSMGNWIFDLILFFIALAIFDPNGTFLMSILEMLFNIGMMLLNMVINMIPKIIAMIPPLITKLVDAFVKAMPEIIKALTELFKGMGQIIETLINAIVKNLPKIIPPLVKGLGTLFITLIKMIGKLLPQMIVMLANSFGMIIKELANNIEPIINAIVDALPLIVIALIKAIITLFPILIKAFGTTSKAIVKGFGKLFLKSFILLIAGFLRLFSKLFDGLGKMFEGSAIGKVFEKLSKFFKGLSDIGRQIADTLDLSGVADKILNMFSDLWDWLGDRFPFNLFKGKDNYKQSDVEEIFESEGGGDKLLKKLAQGEIVKDEKEKKQLEELAKKLAEAGKLKDMTGDSKVDSSDLQTALKSGNKDLVDAIKKIRGENKDKFTTPIFTASDIKTF